MKARAMLSRLAVAAVGILAAWQVAVAEPLPLVVSPAVDVSQTTRLAQAAAIAHDGVANLFVAWEELGGRFLQLSRSQDGAASFEPPVLVVPGADFLSFGQIRMDSGGLDDVQLVYTSFNLIDGTAEIVYSRSTDGGESFPNVQLLSFVDGYNSFAPDIAVGWGVAAAWSNTRFFDGANRIDFALSLDDGETFGPPQRIDAGPGFVSSPAVALGADGIVYAAWVQDDDPMSGLDLFEIYFTRSLDYGLSFSTPIAASPNDERSWPPDIAVDSAGRIYLLWTEGEFGLDEKLLLAVSNDGGDSFEEPLQLAGPVPEVFGNVVASSAGAVWVAWTQSSDPGNFDALRSYVVQSLDGGATFSDPFELAGAYAIDSYRSGELFVAWHDEPAGQSVADVYAARAEVALCGDANLDSRVSAADALAVLRVSVGAAACPLCRCDVNDSNAVTAADALAVLRVAVGQPIPLICPAC